MKEPENGPVHPKSISFTSYEIVEQGTSQDYEGIGGALVWRGILIQENAIPEGRDPV